VFLRCMSVLFHTVLVTHLLVSLVVFSSKVSIFPFAPSFYFFDLPPPPSPGLLSPCALCGPIIQSFYLFPLSVTNYFLLFNHLFVFFEFLISYKLFIILVINLSVPCPVFVGSALAPCHWFLLLGRVGVVFIGRRLSLLILFIIFETFFNDTVFFYIYQQSNTVNYIINQSVNLTYGK
jgi:hypothetical protein